MKQEDESKPFWKQPTNLIFLLSLLIALFAVAILHLSTETSSGNGAEPSATDAQGGTVIAIVSGTPIHADPGVSRGAIDVEPAIVLPNFRLHSGPQHEVQLSDFRGRYVLLFFGYTHCPDVCPLTLDAFRRIQDALAEELQDDIVFLFVTLDQERDTPERLSEYISALDIPIVALWGNEEEIADMGQSFGLEWDIIGPSETASMPRSGEHQTHMVQHEGDYLIDHTSSRYLIDPAGRLIRRYLYHPDPGTSAAWMLADLLPILQGINQDRSAANAPRWQ
ncbi:MAG: SCO family protein [Chloroflexi bacterium]|nr:SCO family protein [Chloroflexota bacterium]